MAGLSFSLGSGSAQTEQGCFILQWYKLEHLLSPCLRPGTTHSWGGGWIPQARKHSVCDLMELVLYWKRKSANNRQLNKQLLRMAFLTVFLQKNCPAQSWEGPRFLLSRFHPGTRPKALEYLAPITMVFLGIVSGIPGGRDVPSGAWGKLVFKHPHCAAASLVKAWGRQWEGSWHSPD